MVRTESAIYSRERSFSGTGGSSLHTFDNSKLNSGNSNAETKNTSTRYSNSRGSNLSISTTAHKLAGVNTNSSNGPYSSSNSIGGALLTPMATSSNSISNSLFASNRSASVSSSVNHGANQAEQPAWSRKRPRIGIESNFAASSESPIMVKNTNNISNFESVFASRPSTVTGSSVGTLLGTGSKRRLEHRITMC